MRQFSYQLYSSRNFPPLKDTLRMVADQGYAHVEGFGGLYGPDADVAQLRSYLDDCGLTMPTGHFSLEAVRDTPDRVIATAKLLGMQALFVPAVAADQRTKDADGWRDLGRELTEIGHPIREAGLDFGWHNHAFELVDIDGDKLPLDLILEGNDLAFEIDIAWIKVGGQNPLDWIDRYSDRIISAHIKDIAPDGEASDEDGWADVGHGTLDWPPIVAALDKTECRTWVMEHDNPNDHERFARRSLATAKGF